MNSLAAPPRRRALPRVERRARVRAGFRLARHALQHRHDPARVHAPVDRVLARLDDRGEIFVLRVAHRALAIARRRVGSARRDRARRDAVDDARETTRRTPRDAECGFDRRAALDVDARRARARGDGRRRDRGTDRGGRVRTRDVRADDGGCARGAARRMIRDAIERRGRARTRRGRED